MPRELKVERLGAHSGSYRFDLVKNPGGDRYVCIPGHGGGRDGPTDPDHPEQEAWMRAHSGLKEVWYLTWEIRDDADLALFRERLEEASRGELG